MKDHYGIQYLGCPVGSGQTLWGVEEASEDLRTNTTLLKDLSSIGYDVTDNGDYEGTIEKSIYEVIYDDCEAQLKKGGFPLWVGGDHSQAMATVSGLLNHNKDLKVFWFDAHGDFNTPATSPSGNWHGMPLAALCGVFPKTDLTGMTWMKQSLKPQNICLFGIRDIDEEERGVIDKLGVKCFTMRDIKQLGLKQALQEATDYLGDFSPIHISFDVDGVDPTVIPATGTAVAEGLSLVDTLELSKHIAKVPNVISMEIVEYNPQLAKSDTELNDSRKFIQSFLTTFFQNRK